MAADVRLGEAWYRGPVILSWAEVIDDCRHLGHGRNVVWHEFAHQLDMLDRAIDGTPPLGQPRAIPALDGGHERRICPPARRPADGTSGR